MSSWLHSINGNVKNTFLQVNEESVSDLSLDGDGCMKRNLSDPLPSVARHLDTLATSIASQETALASMSSNSTEYFETDYSDSHESTDASHELKADVPQLRYFRADSELASGLNQLGFLVEHSWNNVAEQGDVDTQGLLRADLEFAKGLGKLGLIGGRDWNDISEQGDIDTEFSFLGACSSQLRAHVTLADSLSEDEVSENEAVDPFSSEQNRNGANGSAEVNLLRHQGWLPACNESLNSDTSVNRECVIDVTGMKTEQVLSQMKEHDDIVRQQGWQPACNTISNSSVNCESLIKGVRKKMALVLSETKECENLLRPQG